MTDTPDPSLAEVPVCVPFETPVLETPRRCLKPRCARLRENR